MQIRYAFSELGTGLRRNVTMTVAVIVTVWISLVLFGLGMLIRSEVGIVKGFWYDKVEIAVFMCNGVSSAPQCADGAVSAGQRGDIQQALESNPEVRKIFHETQQQAFARYQEIYKDAATAKVVEAKDLPESFRVSLKNPEDYQGVVSAVQGLPGVFSVQGLPPVARAAVQGTQRPAVDLDRARRRPARRGGPADRQHDPAHGVQPQT